IDLDVVNSDLAVAKPVRVPAVCLLAQVLFGLVPMVWSDLGLDELVVPRAFSELAPQRLARERANLGLRLPMLHERVADIEEDGTKGHAAIVSAPTCWISNSSRSSRSGDSARRAESSWLLMGRA